MPANLTPDYERAEQKLREAATDEERLEALQEMFRTLPKHKGTEKMQADIKRRISQLRKAMAKKPAFRGADPFHVPRGGAGQVVLVGPPNVGKSLLVAVTTHAAVKVADYPFTTQWPAPGMWPHEDVKIELVDTPPVAAEHVPPGLIGTIRAADVICVVVDAAGGGLEQADMVLALLAERQVTLRSVPRGRLDPGDPHQRCGLLVANRADLATQGDLTVLRDLYADKLEMLAVSAATGTGLEQLRHRLWQLLDVIRVYTKQPGQPADRTNPFILPTGSTVEDVAGEVHRELPEKMRFARLWTSGRPDGQQVRREEVLHDKDVVEIHE